MPMISPTPGDVHVNGTLTNLSLAYQQAESNFVADRVFPNVPVTKQSDIYWVWPRDAWNRDEMKHRAPGAESAGTNFEVAQAPYYAPVQAIHHDIPDQVMANADNPLAYDTAATNLVSRKALIRRETSFITNYFVLSKWTLGSIGGDLGTGLLAQTLGLLPKPDLSGVPDAGWDEGPAVGPKGGDPFLQTEGPGMGSPGAQAPQVVPAAPGVVATPGGAGGGGGGGGGAAGAGGAPGVGASDSAAAPSPAAAGSDIDLEGGLSPDIYPWRKAVF